MRKKGLICYFIYIILKLELRIKLNFKKKKKWNKYSIIEYFVSIYEILYFIHDYIYIN